MALVLTQEGAVTLWRWILGCSVPVTPTVHLLGAAPTITHTTVESTLLAAELPIACGYGPLSLGSCVTEWAIAPISIGAEADHVTVSWTFTCLLTVYGYWISDDTHGVSLWAELFSAPYVTPFIPVNFCLNLSPQLVSCPGLSACP